MVEIHARSSLHPIDVKVHDIRGEAEAEVKGTEILLDHPVSGYVELDVESLQSGKTLEDMELRRRLEVKKHPTIRYDLKQASGGPERYKLRGSLTLHGVTREFDESATARIEGDTLYVDGEHTFNIEDFGVKAPKVLTLQVYPDVGVTARLIGKPE